MIKTRHFPLALLIIASATLGCSKPSQAPARISGSLSYKGQPIKAGTMAFHTPEGVAYGAKINEDGTYSATDIPEGELVVTVDTEFLNPAKKAGSTGSKDAAKYMKMGGMQPPPSGPGAAAEPKSFYTQIPQKYSNAKTSPLTVTTTKGRQVHNIELTD